MMSCNIDCYKICYSRFSYAGINWENSSIILRKNVIVFLVKFHQEYLLKNCFYSVIEIIPTIVYLSIPFNSWQQIF